MQHRLLAESRQASRAERALAENWALCARVLGIYPAGNARIETAFAQLEQSIDQVAGENTRVPLVFFRENVWVNGAAAQIGDSPNLNWLRIRCDRVALAGIVFRPPVPRESQTALLHHLLEISHREPAGVEFEHLWPVLYPRIDIVPRRFVGLFVNHGEADRSMGTGAPELARWLERHESIQNRMREMQAEFELLTFGGGADTTQFDLLGSIVRLLPSEIVSDAQSLIDSTERVLDEIIAAVQMGGEAERRRDDLSELLFSVARKMFFRAVDSKAKTDTTATPDGAEALPLATSTGHAGDEWVLPDIDALIEELERLPPAEDTRYAESDFELAEESIDTLLYYLVSGREGLADALQEPLVRALENRSDAALAVLRRWLALPPQLGDSTRLVSFLRQRDLMPLALRGLVSVERVVATFPAGFGVFLDSLDSRSRNDQTTLVRVAEQLGVDRVLDAVDALRREGIDAEDRAARILAGAAPALVPFYHALLRGAGAGVSEQIRALLRRINPGDREAIPLRLLPDSMISNDYLVELTARRENGAYPPRLSRRVSLMLVDFIRQSSDREARIYAITILRSFVTVESRALLEELITTRGRFGWRREHASVRSAVAETLRAMEVG